MCQKHRRPAMEASLLREGWFLRVATMKREIVLETCVPENQTPGGEKKKPSGLWLARSLPFLPAASAEACGRAGIWARGGEGSWLRGREENGNPELIPGINLIVSIPPHEYLELYSPKLFWLPQNSFPLFQSFPEMGFGASESQIPDPSEPGVRKALDTGNFRWTHFSPSAEISRPKLGVFIQ